MIGTRLGGMTLTFGLTLCLALIARSESRPTAARGTDRPADHPPRPSKGIPASPIRASWGKASHVVEAAVVEAAVHRRSGEKLEDLPETLAKREYLDLTLHITRTLSAPDRDLDGPISVRLGAPGLELLPFLAALTNRKKIFFLKRDLQYKEATYYYPADPRLFFTEVDHSTEIEHWVKKRNQSTPPSPVGAMAYYGVPGRVSPLLQEGPNGCWAAVVAMMLSWRDLRDYTSREAASLAGADLAKLLTYGKNTGLDKATKERLLNTLGFQAENPQTFTPAGLRELLQEHGPLWVTINAGGSRANFVLTHARLVVAIQGEGPPEHVKLTFVDPAKGRLDTQDFQQFTDSFESVAKSDLKRFRDAGGGVKGNPFQPQIIHY
jgi:Papain-like cysteine protease AvrRpt2